MKTTELQQQLSSRAAAIKKLAAEMIDLTHNEVECGRMEADILKSSNSIYDNAIKIEEQLKKLK